MNEFLQRGLNPVILIYVVSAMLALGLGQTVSHILGPLRSVRLTLSAVVASYLILPLLAALTARLFALEPGLRYGLVLMAMSAGAEVGPLLTTTSNANVRLSAGILVLSLGITILYLPLMLGVLLPDVHFDVKHLLLKLFLTIVAPLLLGLLIRSRWEKVAHAAEKPLHQISRVFVILLTVIVLLLYYRRIMGMFGTYAILAAIISVVGGFGIGYLLGWPERGTRLAMGYMHGARSASIAVMVAADVFRDQPNAMLMIATVTLFILGLLIPASFLFRIKHEPGEEQPQSIS
ncbi:MAG: bile acid:sodium symporter [Verrucomicrobia bacterium]|nr:bile acid:sodium symporter [Verrucomicrobiota bacterium]